MSRTEMLEKLTDIFREILDNEEIVLTEKTTPEDIEEWDSLGHVYLITEIEDEFSIEFGEEIDEIQNVGDIINFITMKVD